MLIIGSFDSSARDGNCKKLKLDTEIKVKQQLMLSIVGSRNDSKLGHHKQSSQIKKNNKNIQKNRGRILKQSDSEMDKKKKSKASNCNLVDRYLRRRILRFESLIPESIHRSYVSIGSQNSTRTASDSSAEERRVSSALVHAIATDASLAAPALPQAWQEIFVLPVVPSVAYQQAYLDDMADSRTRSLDARGVRMDGQEKGSNIAEDINNVHKMNRTLFEEALDHIERSVKGRRRR